MPLYSRLRSGRAPPRRSIVMTNQTEHWWKKREFIDTKFFEGEDSRVVSMEPSAEHVKYLPSLFCRPTVCCRVVVFVGGREASSETGEEEASLVETFTTSDGCNFVSSLYPFLPALSSTEMMNKPYGEEWKNKMMVWMVKRRQLLESMRRSDMFFYSADMYEIADALPIPRIEIGEKRV